LFFEFHSITLFYSPDSCLHSEGPLDPNSSLNVFLTVVKERSFTRAAEKLFRTQPAVSLAIQRLETELGERLLDRSGRDLALTEAGRLVYECARRQENTQRELATQLEELRNKSMGRLTLGANESMTLYLLPHLIVFRQHYPKIKLVVQRSRSTELPDTLALGDVDFGIMSYRSEDERFESIPLYTDHLSFVVPPDHRLAHRRSVSVKDLGMETFVAHNVSSPYRDTVIREFQKQKVSLNMDIEMPTVESIRLMVQAGQGLAFLPRMCVDQDLRQGLLKEIQVKELQLKRTIYLVRVSKRPLSHAGKAFLEVVKSKK
jgi:DNA-binding transcriptional LysR family regulator